MAVACACADGDEVSAGVVDEAEDVVESGDGVWGAVGFEAVFFAADDTDFAFDEGVVGFGEGDDFAGAADIGGEGVGAGVDHDAGPSGVEAGADEVWV